MPVKKGEYSVVDTAVTSPAASALNIPSATGQQSFAYFNGVIFQFYSDNGLALIDYATGSMIAALETDTLHGNAC